MKKSFLNGTAAFLIAALAVALVLACSTPAGDGGGNPAGVKDNNIATEYYAGVEGSVINFYELTITGGKAFKLVIYDGSGSTVDTIEGTVKSKSGSKYYLEAPWVASTTPVDGIYPKTTVLIEATVKDGNITNLTAPGDDFLPGNVTFTGDNITAFNPANHEPGSLLPGVAYLVIKNDYHDYKITEIKLNTPSGSYDVPSFVDSGDENLVVNYQRSSKKIPLKIDFANYSGNGLGAKVTVTTNDDPTTPTQAVVDDTDFQFGKTTVITVKVKTGDSVVTAANDPPK
jgi:hypothetical protein